MSVCVIPSIWLEGGGGVVGLGVGMSDLGKLCLTLGKDSVWP